MAQEDSQYNTNYVEANENGSYNNRNRVSDDEHGANLSTNHDNNSNNRPVARTLSGIPQTKLRDKHCCCCILCCKWTQPREAGRMALLYGEIGKGPQRGQFPKSMLLGPDWPCAIITIALITSATIIWGIFVALPIHPAVAAIGFFTMVLVLLAFLITSCSDPGILPRREFPMVDEDDPDGLPCRICHVMRPPGTIHCSFCGVCIQGLDHHCPWTGKCIGKYNIRMFNTFLILLGVHIVYVIAIIGAFVAIARRNVSST